MKYNMGMSDRKPNRKPVRRTGTSRTVRSTTARRPSSMRLSGNSLRTTKTTVSRTPRSGYRKAGRLTSRFSFSRGSGSKSAAPKGRKAKMKKAMARAFVIMSSVGFVTVIVFMIVTGLYLKSLQSSLPDPDRLVDWTSDESTTIYDRNGKELFKIYGAQNREFVSIDKYPEHTKWALLAAEDGEFYEHKGLDWKGIISCGIVSTKSYLSESGSGQVCGASTITQQLVRNTLMFEVYGDEAFERSTIWKAGRRKIRELLLSMQVERSLSKDDILQLYMNEVPLGGVVYGYGAASSSYFGKDVEDLTLEESALLAGLIQSPGIYSPIYGLSPELAVDRQEYVFGQLETMSFKTNISQEDIDAAREVEMVYESADIDIEAYHWVFYVKQQLEAKYGPEIVQRGGLKVTTTLDFSTQKIAEEEVINGVAKYGHKWGVMNGSLLAMDPKTGQILAMVGSVDPNESEDRRIDGTVNITTSLRQMGSSFKPYVYLTAFQQYGPWLETADINYDFGNYKPTNWDVKSEGIMVAREALVKSRNIPANYTLQTVGIDKVIENAEKMGITTLTDRNNYGLSLALGAAEMTLLEHTAAYGVFATGGIYREPVSILKIEDSSGEVLEEWKPTEGVRVIEEADAYMVNWALCDLGSFGDQILTTSYNINGKRAACGKTGTTNGPKDLVSMQYHPNLVVGMWSGNNNGQEVPGAWSTSVPLPIVHAFVERMSNKYPPEGFSRPADIVDAQVCDDTGRLADEGTNCTKVKTIYHKSRPPQKDEREVVQVCKGTNRVSTNTSQASQFDLLASKTLLKFTLENSNQQGSFNNYIQNLENSVYIVDNTDSGPCELPLGPGGAPVIDLITPTADASFTPGKTVTIETTVRAEGAIDHVDFSFDGELLKTVKSAPYKYDYTIPAGTSSGDHTITVTVVDSQGRSDNASVTIVVGIDTSNASIRVTSPAAGATITSLPVTVRATVSGFTPESVTFRIQKVGDSTYIRSVNDLNGSDGWSGRWDDTSTSGITANGQYTIQAFGINNGVVSLIGNTITVTYTSQ